MMHPLTPSRRFWRVSAAACILLTGFALASCASPAKDTDPLPARADIVAQAPDTRPLWRKALRPAWVARQPRWIQALWFIGPGH